MFSIDRSCELVFDPGSRRRSVGVESEEGIGVVQQLSLGRVFRWLARYP